MVLNGRYTSPISARASPPTGVRSPANRSTHCIFNITTKERREVCPFPFKAVHVAEFSMGFLCGLSFQNENIYCVKRMMKVDCSRLSLQWLGMSVILKLEGMLSWSNRVCLIVHALSSFIYLSILETFTTCAAQTSFGSYGEIKGLSRNVWSKRKR